MDRETSQCLIISENRRRKEKTYSNSIGIRFGVIIPRNHSHHDEPSVHVRVLERKIEDFTADVVPVAVLSTAQRGFST